MLTVSKAQPGHGVSSEVLDLLRRARDLSPQERQDLDRLREDQHRREIDAVQSIGPDIKQPWFGTLSCRAWETVRSMAGFLAFEKVTVGHCDAVRDAAAAAFARGHLPAAFEAALMGPWLAVVEGDPAGTESPFSPEGRRQLTEWAAMPNDVFIDPDDIF